MICFEGMKPWIFSSILLLVSSFVRAEEDQRWTLSAEEWARPRHGEVLVQMKPIVDSVQNWMNKPGHKIVIYYPGGEEGTIWARELVDWLVSLGIPSSHTQTIPGTLRDDQVTIVLRDE